MKKLNYFLLMVLLSVTFNSFAQDGEADTETIPPLVFAVPDNGIVVINNSDCDDIKVQIGVRGINNTIGDPFSTGILASGGQQTFSFNDVMSSAWPLSNPYGTGYVGFGFNYVGLSVTGGSPYISKYVTALGPDVNFYMTGDPAPCDCLKVTTKVVWSNQATYSVAYLLVLIENC